MSKKTSHKSHGQAGEDNEKWWSLSKILGAALFVVVAVGSSSLLLENNHSGVPLRYEEVEWNTSSPEHHMTEWLKKHDTPVVLHNTPFNKWKSAKWTPNSLAKEPEINQVLSKKGHKNIFHYFANNQPLSEIECLTVSKPYIEVIYPRKQFFNILMEPFDGSYYYSSGGVELLGIRELYSQADLEQLTFWNSKSQQTGQVNFWFGMENVTAYTHYDTSYNFHSISYGRKKFILFPPEVYSELKLYPCLHQFYRQIHTPVSKISTDEIIQKLDGIEITLFPGEVLFIPPYWFHCVVTIETTLSVNVWSQSEAYLTMEEIYSSPLPFEESWGRDNLMLALDYYWEQLAIGLFEFEYRTLMKRVALERYQPLLKQFSASEKDVFFSRVRKFCSNLHIREILTPKSFEHINDRVKRVRKLLSTIVRQSVREINFGNYVEHTALRVLGYDNLVLLPFYLKQCYDT